MAKAAFCIATKVGQASQIVTDLRQLIDEYGFPQARELVTAKRAGERVLLSGPVEERWSGEVRRAFEVLDEAHKASKLPVEPEGEADLEAWLLAERRKRL